MPNDLPKTRPPEAKGRCGLQSGSTALMWQHFDVLAGRMHDEEIESLLGETMREFEQRGHLAAPRRSPERLYRGACQDYTKRNIDRDKAAAVKGVSLTAPSSPDRDFTQLWRARQRADELGLPYERYLEFTFAFAERRKRKQTPRPSQLQLDACSIRTASATRTWCPG
jgi:hypothetical protein